MDGVGIGGGGDAGGAMVVVETAARVKSFSPLLYVSRARTTAFYRAVASAQMRARTATPETIQRPQPDEPRIPFRDGQTSRERRGIPLGFPSDGVLGAANSSLDLEQSRFSRECTRSLHAVITERMPVISGRNPRKDTDRHRSPKINLR